MEQIIELDKELFIFLHNLGTERWDFFWTIITNPFTWIPLYLALVVLYLHQFSWKKTLLIVVLSVLMIICIERFTDFAKHEVGRLRPCRDGDLFLLMRASFNEIHSHCKGRFGFTSAHAANHFSIAFFMGFLFWKSKPYILFALLIWASMIAYSRIYLGVHFPLDIFFGGMIGTLSALVFRAIYNFILKKFPSVF